MLYNDGIVKIYDLTDGSAPDKRKLKYSSEHWYGEKTVGVTRLYAAKQANCRVDMLIEIWQSREVKAGQYAVPMDGEQYRITEVQHAFNDAGLKVSILTLERLGENYELEGNT